VTSWGFDVAGVGDAALLAFAAAGALAVQAGRRRTSGQLPGWVASERGLALPMALGIMVVLAISVTAVTEYTMSNTRNASNSTAGQLAYAAAESGLNDALSVLYSSGSPHLRASLPDVTTGQSLKSTPRYKVSYTYTSALADPFWTITVVGRVENVTEGTRPVTRTIKRVVQISASAPQGSNLTVWNYVYSDAAPGTTCLTISNTAGFSTPVYAKGDLCLGQTAHLDHNSAWGASSPPQVQVGGTIKLSNNAYVGTSAAHINTVQVANGCTNQSNSTVHACTSADPVWADGITTTPPTLTKPVIDLATWYKDAEPGPSHACTTSSGTPPAFDNDTLQNASLGNVNLTPAVAYDCQFKDPFGNLLGQIKWDPPSGGGAYGNLTFNGAIFFDGNLNWTANAVYHGRGTIYFGGTINFSTNNTYLCGSSSACDATWNTSTDLLVLVAGSNAQSPSFAINLGNAVKFQGSLEAVGDVNESNGDALWGSVIAHQVYLANGATDYYVPFGTPVPGQPGLSGPQESLIFPPNSFSG
jgi:Tfp pilus assembly protein PilX